MGNFRPTLTITRCGLFGELATNLAGRSNRPFDFVVTDEAQDIGICHLRFLAALAAGGDRPNALFFTGDIGQRIFQQPFSWKALGVDIRGRSRNLRVNYRTSHQIRLQADRLLGPEVSDVDGNVAERGGTVSVFNGPPPTIRAFADEEAEIEAVAAWLKEKNAAGLHGNEFGVLVRSWEQIERGKEAIKRSGLFYKILTENAETAETSGVTLTIMHLAKGLEFRAVVVMACDDEVIPLQSRIETVTDESDLEEVYNTERHLLYVACTRARDHLLITSVAPASEFLDDLKA